ncbi:hypothetical protein VD0002_g3461 [Verticillium dahliae]|uniref:Kinetochore protein mis14 n=2 Tax=Verticillium dahliae TaxID=27337 RepID=G2WSS9_VERDV|nr:uncharacterized protein VDAG_00860 [Verticillium dahliae VdLs.17]KAF3348803.1 Aminotriazole resistance protein [Verticillium dahliae VDG2]KAH6701730.1 hypothetical protein EV126DRAFT_362219 [Verticillium dahliae]EGY17178.1 hypothetical protein VDAG_00860 [Verticillium dahliae VdLs.17]PNH32577.1 hypothetical protein BJF96_g4193 [Verticillium dahliae]PNH53155.1 hypothetical protein VD0003_g4218 [Verticillium dahliae]
MDSESTEQRRIELQAPEDLAYLLSNVRRAAQDHLNDAFPPMEGNAGDEDELRIQIEKHVNEYITKTFTHAAPNLSLNGLPAEPKVFLAPDADAQTALEPQVEYEPWDARLRQKVEDLARQEEELLNEIAALKKTVPSDVAGEQTRRLKEARTRDEEELAERKRQADLESAELDVGVLERQDGVESAHRNAIEGLGKVKREMPSTVAKMERARVAGEYVVTGR